MPIMDSFPPENLKIWVELSQLDLKTSLFILQSEQRGLRLLLLRQHKSMIAPKLWAIYAPINLVNEPPLRLLFLTSLLEKIVRLLESMELISMLASQNN